MGRRRGGGFASLCVRGRSDERWKVVMNLVDRKCEDGIKWKRKEY